MTVRSFVLPVVCLLLSTSCASAPKVSPPPPRDVIVLLPDDRGKTGAIVVSGAGVERRLDRPGQSVTVAAGSPPGEPVVLPEGEIRAEMGAALDALPKPPVRYLLYFHHDSTELTGESRVLLRELLGTIRERRPLDISVVGHTDTMGRKEYNDALAWRRAKAIAAILGHEGVDPSIIEIASHGKENPLIPTGDQVREPRNRRVEITVR